MRIETFVVADRRVEQHILDVCENRGGRIKSIVPQPEEGDFHSPYEEWRLE
jgi:hypothetical protein